jgi:hypothetical protein
MLQQQVGDFLATVKREDDESQPFEGSTLFHDHLQDVAGVFGGRITPPPQPTHTDTLATMDPAASIESITDIAKLPLPPSNAVLVAMRYARSNLTPETLCYFPTDLMVQTTRFDSFSRCHSSPRMKLWNFARSFTFPSSVTASLHFCLPTAVCCIYSMTWDTFLLRTTEFLWKIVKHTARYAGRIFLQQYDAGPSRWDLVIKIYEHLQAVYVSC